MASASIAWRVVAGGQPSPTTCSFRFSPAPTPKWKRPFDIAWIVAAFWATIAGW